MVTVVLFLSMAPLAACDPDKSTHLPAWTPFSPESPRFLILGPPMSPQYPPPPPRSHKDTPNKNAFPSSQLPTTSVPFFPPLLLPQPSPPPANAFKNLSSSLPSSSPASHSHPELVNTTDLTISQEQMEDNDTSPLEPRRPHLARTSTFVRVHSGRTAKLDCLVYDAANESVSWLRREDDILELLTWADNTYTNDNRFSVVQEAGSGWRLWRLEIRGARKEDQGDYRCHAATHPPLLLDATLAVDVPSARVVDERGDQVEEKHYNSGSMIELKCIVEQVPFPHGPVTWRREHTALSFNTSRGGISVRGEPDWGFVRSRLYVARAQPTDSGRYSCCYDNTTCDSITVHVIAGENSAAMQHDAIPESPSSGLSRSSCPYTLHLLLSACVLTCLVSWRTS